MWRSWRVWASSSVESGSRNRRSYIACPRQGRGNRAAIEVVMMGDVVFRPAARIELADVAAEIARPPLRLGTMRTSRAAPSGFPAVGDRAVLDHEGAAIIGFAKIKRGVRRMRRSAATVTKRHRDRASGSIPQVISFPLAVVTVKAGPPANAWLRIVTQQYRPSSTAEPAPYPRRHRTTDSSNAHKHNMQPHKSERAGANACCQSGICQNVTIALRMRHNCARPFAA